MLLGRLGRYCFILPQACAPYRLTMMTVAGVNKILARISFPRLKTVDNDQGNIRSSEVSGIVQWKPESSPASLSPPAKPHRHAA